VSDQASSAAPEWTVASPSTPESAPDQRADRDDPADPADPAADRGATPADGWAGPPVTEGGSDPALAALREQAAESAERQAAALAEMTAQLGELLRLRSGDIDLADRLYAENTRLRTGEFAVAVAPLHIGLLRLHDQMTSLADGDAASVAGMLRIQLLQILDTAAGLSPFEPRPGERFDSARHAGVGRAGTTDPAAEGTVAKTIKPGFERADGSVIRVAQVEVYRFESR